MGPAHDSLPSDSSKGHHPDGRTASWQLAVWSVVRFGVLVVSISLVLGLLAIPWSPIPLWKVFRRCVSIAAALSLWICISWIERRTIRSYGLPRGRGGNLQVLCGWLLGFGILALAWGVDLASGWCRIQITPDHWKLWRTVLGFIPAAALVGVLEELVFRGFILQHLLACSKSVALTVSSGLYAIVHVKGLTFDLATWLELGGLFLLGVVLSLSYLATRQLYLAIGLHAALAYGARVNKLLLEFPNPSLSWLVGTNRLVNGLMNWVILLAVGGAIVWWTRSFRGGGLRHEDA